MILKTWPHGFIEQVQQTNHWRGRNPKITRIVAMDGDLTVEIIGAPIGLSNIRVTDKTNGGGNNMTFWDTVRFYLNLDLEEMADMTMSEMGDYLEKKKKNEWLQKHERKGGINE